MKNWRRLFEIVRFPIEVLFVAFILTGVGNVLTNNIFGIVYLIDNDYVKMIAEICMKSGQFVIVNFPLLFLIRLVARKNGSSVTIISALLGYIAFLATTMLVTRGDLTSTSYSSILGMNLSKSSIVSYSGVTRYPLQTGMLGIGVIAFGTLFAFHLTKNRDEYGLFSFVSKEVSCAMKVVIYSILIGVVFSFVWPYVIAVIDKLISFIAVDTTNPVNLTLYGCLDSLLSTLNLGTLIRSPFWYGMNGGSWIGMAGTVSTGDVSVWAAQIAADSVSGQAGRFITPYYILNLFAMPGLIWGMYSMETNPLNRPKMRMLCILATIVSILFGTMLPLELMLLFLAPLLFLAHIACTGILFGSLQAFHIYLGFNSTEVSTMTALPGTLPELITYISNSTFHTTILFMMIVGAVVLLLYFFMTRFYFNALSVDLFRTGDKDRLVKGALKALGGIENIKALESNCFALTVAVYEPEKMDMARLKRLGATRVVEIKTGFQIYFGSTSTLIRNEINKERRNIEN